MLQSVFFTKLLTSGVFFSTAIGAVVVAKLLLLRTSPLTAFILVLREALLAKLVILGISSLTSFILVLKEVLIAKLVISRILSSIYLILALFTSFLTTSVAATSLSLLKSTGTGTNLSRSNLSTLVLKFLRLIT